MTTDDFRSIALGLPEAVEASHMNHPDFRIRGRIFATLPNPDNGEAVVMLTPELQAQFVRDEPKVFAPVKGGWGRKGATSVQMSNACQESVQSALLAAWRKIAPKKLIQEHDLEE
jgi:hypothetical protein